MKLPLRDSSIGKAAVLDDLVANLSNAVYLAYLLHYIFTNTYCNFAVNFLNTT